MKNLKEYNTKRNFNKTKEPIGNKNVKHKKLRFVVQHHLARKDHYDLRLEYEGVLKSWAVPKGPSFNPKDKRLAVMVEDHPFNYRNFEGTIPKGEYGGGTVMLFDEGYYEATNNFKEGLKKGVLKFKLLGTRLKGNWTLIHFKGDNWLLIKEKDEYLNFDNINNYHTSCRSGRTMEEIEANLKLSSEYIKGIEVTNPNKLLFKKPNVKKIEVVKYYQTVAKRMLPYLERRIISVVRCPEGTFEESFFKKHLEDKRSGLTKIKIKNKEKKTEDYFYINNIEGIINEAQMNTIEFHIWGSNVNELNKPNIMVFDLDPDEGLTLKKLREGVKDLKSILDKLNLKSYLKTSGGKGYHVVVPIKDMTWNEFRNISKQIAELMETKWPEKYTSNIRKEKRVNKIFIDWQRNIKGSTFVAPYSLRAKNKPTVSMPISWKELDTIKPNEITMKKALERIKKTDPWKNFFFN